MALRECFPAPWWHSNVLATYSPIHTPIPTPVFEKEMRLSTWVHTSIQRQTSHFLHCVLRFVVVHLTTEILKIWTNKLSLISERVFCSSFTVFQFVFRPKQWFTMSNSLSDFMKMINNLVPSCFYVLMERWWQLTFTTEKSEVSLQINNFKFKFNTPLCKRQMNKKKV